MRPISFLLFNVLLGLLLLDCRTQERSITDEPVIPAKPETNRNLSVSNESHGLLNILDLTVFGFSQTLFNQQDGEQVFALHPDITMRAWQRFGTREKNLSEYNREYITDTQKRSIRFIGGGTASVLFEDEAKDRKEFLDWATRDAKNELVPIWEEEPKAWRASLANPGFRDYLAKHYYYQIDLGVDGIFMDEANGNYSGEKKWNWNGNEGFDDYFISDFNRFLINKYPYFTEKDWLTQFGMTRDNVINSSIAYNDLNHNFNYRFYLLQKGFSSNPMNSANPLAKEWGRCIANRPSPDSQSFLGTYLPLYFREIVGKVRRYAREKYHKEILVTSNGIFPDTDFNSIGLYDYNLDDAGKQAFYVPLIGNKLDGSKSLLPVFLGLREKSIETSGPVPTVFFLDWPCPMINGYYALSKEQKIDYWKIYAAEAYAAGCIFAFHLKTDMPNEPSATQSGIMEFLVQYSSFYKNNRSLFTPGINEKIPVSVSKPGISSAVRKQRQKEGLDQLLIHLINHNYRGSMIPQKNITVSVPCNRKVTSLQGYSPDSEKVSKIVFFQDSQNVSFSVDELNFSGIFVLSF